MTTTYPYHPLVEDPDTGETVILAYGELFEEEASGGEGPAAVLAASQRRQRMLKHTEPRFWMQW
jgi:hypothetical protein